MDAEAVVRALVEVWNSEDPAALTAVVAPEVEHDGRLETVAEQVAWLEAEAAVWGSPRYTIRALVCDGREVAFRWRAEARHVGRWGPVAATGRLVAWEGAHFVTVEDGLVTRLWALADRFEKAMQLDARLGPPDAP